MMIMNLRAACSRKLGPSRTRWNCASEFYYFQDQHQGLNAIVFSRCSDACHWLRRSIGRSVVSHVRIAWAACECACSLNAVPALWLWPWSASHVGPIQGFANVLSLWFICQLREEQPHPHLTLQQAADDVAVNLGEVAHTTTVTT